MKTGQSILNNIDIINQIGDIKEFLNLDIPLITSNSKEVINNAIFVAIVGNAVSGLDFISDAIKAGAKIIICDSDINTLILNKDYVAQNDGRVLFLEVKNARLVLAKMLANFYHNELPQNLFTITGTNGKSSTAMLTSQLLNTLNRPTITIGTLGIYYNNNKHGDCLTTPGPEKLNEALHKAWLDGISHGVMESSSHGIHQDRIADLEFVAIGWTNLTQDHLDYHKTMEEYYLSKQKLFMINPKSTAVINVDDNYGKRLAKECEKNNIKVTEYGRSAKHFKILEIIKHPSCQFVRILINGIAYEFTIGLAGEFQVYNTLCAVAMLSCLKVEIVDLLDACGKLMEIEGRLNLIISPINGAKIFVDFAHTPNALEEVLKGLKKENPKSLKVLFGCGGNRDNAKRPIMGAIATIYADKIYISDDNPRFEDPSSIRLQIIEGIKSKNFNNFEEIDNREVAIGKAIAELQDDEILLIAGKGHETYQIIGAKANYFNDKEVVLKFLGVN